MPIEHDYTDMPEDVTPHNTPETSTETPTETPTEMPTETPVETEAESPDDNHLDSEGSISQDIITEEKHMDSHDEDDIINTKEDIKYFMDKSKNSQELYENAIKVLENLERNFKRTLRSVLDDEDDLVRNSIRDSSFNLILDTEDPVTLFEKKWKELLERAEQIEENLRLQNSASQIIWEWDLNAIWIDENEKNKLIEELFQTRDDAIQDFKEDLADWFLDNENNISRRRLLSQWRQKWKHLFYLKETDKKAFEEEVNNMNLIQLTFYTFNIEKWSWAFAYCYWKLKENLWKKNLFDFIDEQNNSWGQTSEILKYSAFKMLFQRRKTSDLSNMIDWYSWNKEDLVKYVEKNIKEDEKFKISFLTSIKDLEGSKYFWDIAKNLKENDPDVKRAYEAASNIDNIDIFKYKKVNGLMIYDNEGHGWWAAYFDADLRDYQSKGFRVAATEDNKDYKKCILKKGNDVLTMLKIKELKMNDMEDSKLQSVLTQVVRQEDYNLFALRWHCHNTEQAIWVLWTMNIVWEWDLIIDGWCNNANNMRSYYNSWIKWQMCAYIWEWRWNPTQSFIDNIIKYKNEWKSFSSLLWYYNSLTTDTSYDGYYAFNTERPDSVGTQYKKLTGNGSENGTIRNNLVQDLETPVGSESQHVDGGSDAGAQVQVDDEAQVQADSEAQTQVDDA